MALGRQVPTRPVIIELGGSNLPIGKSMPDLVLPHIRDQLYTSLGPYINPYPNDIFDCELISRHCPHLFATQVAIRNEVWRKEPTMKPNFAGKCLVCGEEHEDEVKACPTCGGLVRPPDPKEKRIWFDFKKVMNAQGQLPLDMCRQQQIDITRFDDAFFVYLYDYWVDDFGHILAQKVINATRGTPGRILLVNDEYGIVGGQLRKSGGVGLYTCVLHREENLQMDNKRPCIKCGRTLVPVKWVEVNNQNRPVMGLLDIEVFHWSHYQPTIDYGFAPPAALWTEASTLVNQTRLAATTYEQQRPAKGILVIATTDAEGMNSQFKQWDVELSVNPNYLCKLAYNPIEGMGAGGGVREPVKYIPLTQSMEELKFIDMRKEFRQTIEAVYGVSDQTLSDTQSSGGLNQEGLKITVTLRTVEVHQETWHDKPFKDLFSKLGIMDWHLEFDPPVESDKDKPLGRRVQNIGLMDNLLKMGAEFDIDDPEDFHFKLTKPPTQAAQQAQALGPLGTPLPGVGGGMGGADKKRPTDILTLDLSKGCCGAEKAEERNRFLGHLEAAFREALGQMELPRIPIQAELMRAVKATLDRARQNWTTAVLQDYARLLEAGIRSVGHLEEVAVDLNALAAAQLRMSPMWSAYSGMTDDLAHDFNTLILEAIATPQEFDLRRLRKRMLARAREVAETRLDRIARTETQVLSNKGRELHYKVDDDGTQLYQFIHARTFRLCPACDKIMRLIGKGQPLEVCRRIVHEVTQAYMGPAWVVRDWSVHPNCILPDTPVVGDVLGALRSQYSGPVIKIVTRMGRSLTVTPNHPVLTVDGFVLAGQLQNGVQLVCYRPADEGMSSVDHYNKDEPVLVEKVFDMLALLRVPKAVPVAPEDLHGDAKFGDGHIDVVDVDGELPHHGVASTCELCGSGLLEAPRPDDIALTGLGAEQLALTGVPASATGGPGAAKHSLDITPILAMTLPAQALSLRLGPELNLPFLKSPHDGPAGNPELPGDLVGAYPLDIQFDEIVDIIHLSFTGHVYDLRTTTSYYIASGIFIHNCLGALIRTSGLSKEALDALAKDNYVITDRYDALGMAPPDPATMCHGQCEGTGFVSVHPDMEGDLDPRLVQLWDDAEAEDHSIDGWHFVVCPECNGTGKRPGADEERAGMTQTVTQTTAMPNAKTSEMTQMGRQDG